ncbi:SLAM family member 7-like [Astyanax mexicanus]|uniref:SLAM family member 7-like n=1 Tax=Astyanax mexicanus TaxID=7994 RepID=A0A8T2KNS7_ASTMX|nr:SLAM family member 7-like [Astyanax mexicanus]
METKLQLIFTLSTLISITGSSDVFRAVGGSVQLEIQNPGAEFKILSWIFNGSKNVLDYVKKNNDVDPSSDYKERVEFNDKTYSLTLNKLQKTDSGLYSARASGVTVLAEYRLSVIDAVEPPVLTLYNTTDPCNSTLTCRGHDLSFNSSCYNETCEEKEVTSPEGVALSLYVRDSVIICNHSNPVSWKSAEIKSFRHFCADTVSPPAGVSVCLVKTGLYSIILIILLSAVITVHIRERRNKP